MNRRLLSWIPLLVLLASLAGTVKAQPPIPANGDPPTGPLALVQVTLLDHDNLARFEHTGLPAYVRLHDGHHSFLLAGADPAGLQSLTTAGLSFQILDPSTAGHAYYLAYLMPDRPSPDWNAFGTLLLDDGVQVLLRCSPEQAETLAMAGAEIRRLRLEPKPLRPALAPQVYPTVIDPDPLIQSMIDQVVSPTVYQYDGDLSGEWPVDIGGAPYTIVTRHTYSGEPIQKATEFAGQHLADLGLAVEYHQWSGATYPNVIGELTGQTNPDNIYILCAHIDDMPSGPLAPGADDNASGVVAVLMAADILTQYNWGCTLRFALWTGEEQGLLGSAAYAQRAYQAGENILGVLNLDMIAYNTIGSSPDIDLHADQVGVPPSMQLAQLFDDVVDAYDLNLIPQIVPNGTGASDHASFWNYGYTAILGIEDFGDFNPYYHTVNDLLSNTDLAYFTEFVKASIGTFAHMGCLIPGGLGYLDGTVSAAGTGLPIQGATVSATDAAGHTFPASTDATGYYTRTLLSGTYTVTAAAYGYLSTTVTGVTVLTDAVTTQDFSLTSSSCNPVSNTQFTWSPITPTIGQVVHFTGTADGDDPILYRWGFGDGSTAMGPLTAHAYGSAADYQVVLSTTNACGEQSVVHPITVQPLPCNPVQILEVLTTVDGCTVTYSAVLTGTAPYTYTWDLGAFGSMATPTATVNYIDSGTYPFTLTAINGCGQDIQTGTVTVDCTPPCEPVQSAGFGWEPRSLTIDQPITLTAWVGSRWLTETVDSNLGPPGTFGYNALALDAQGRPHIAYYEHITHNGDLKYAYSDGLAWQVETVEAVGDVGAYPSLALDDSGRPHISYADETGSGGLKYAWHDGTAWLSETVEAGRPGYHTSLALDAQDHPHVSYLSYDWSSLDGNLNYAWHDGVSWQVETVDITGSAGWYSSLALDDLGRPHISYVGSSLCYAHFDGTEWLTETVDPAEAVAFTSIVLDSAGRPHISYVSDGQLKYAHRNGAGPGLNQGWQIETVDGDVSWYTSLNLDGLDRPHISYHDQAGTGLQYAWHDGSHWRIETVASGGPGGTVGQYNALALDGLGRPHASYYDSTNHSLKYARRAATTTPPITYTWDLGNGALAAGEIITHSYDLPGTYTVTLTASNPCGQAVVQHRLVVRGQEQTWTLYLPLVFK